MLLKQPTTNALLRSVSSQACGLDFVEDFDSIVDFIDDGEFRLFKCLLEFFVPVEHFVGLEYIPEG